jgi:hypothetical protein
MAKPTTKESSDQTLELILAELRGIREAIEKPRQTAERENAEFLARLSST